MADKGSLQFHQLCFRFGWATKNLHSAFDYIFNSLEKDKHCGKVLSGWVKKVNGKVAGGYPPTADDITTKREVLYKFIKCLYGHQLVIQSNELKALLIGIVMRFEDDFKNDLMNHPKKRYEDNLNYHPFVCQIEKAKIDSGKFDSRRKFSVILLFRT